MTNDCSMFSAQPKQYLQGSRIVISIAQKLCALIVECECDIYTVIKTFLKLKLESQKA